MLENTRRGEVSHEGMKGSLGQCCDFLTEVEVKPFNTIVRADKFSHLHCRSFRAFVCRYCTTSFKHLTIFPFQYIKTYLCAMSPPSFFTLPLLCILTIGEAANLGRVGKWKVLDDDLDSSDSISSRVAGQYGKIEARYDEPLVVSSSSISSSSGTSSSSSTSSFPTLTGVTGGTAPYSSGGSASTGTAPYALPNATSAVSPTASGTAGTAPVTAQVSRTTGMLDGAPWLDPTSFCDFGSVTYPTVSQQSTVSDSARLCAYTSLNPASAITPKTTGVIPTNRPGYGGVPGCAAVVFGPAHKECPFGTDGWCNCGGTLVPPLAPTKSGIINCAITIQPSANNCPVNTAYSKSLAAASASSASAASVSAANAKATPNTVVSSFACPTDAAVGSPDGLGPGQSNFETVDTPKKRQQLLWSNFNSWGCDMPNGSDNDAVIDELCGGIPDKTVLSLGIGNQPLYLNSTSKTPGDKNCQKQFYNMGFTVKDKCEIKLTKEYCLGMFKNIVQSCPLINPKYGASWEGGVVTDNCGVMTFTSGYDIVELTKGTNNPFFDLTNTYWWE